MGQWGGETFNGDSVMNFLQKYPVDGDLELMTEEMADKTISDVWKTGTNFDKLGVVVWLLTQEFVVHRDILISALKYAQEELLPIALELWGDTHAREKMLWLEINDIKFAKDNGGKGRKREAQNSEEAAMDVLENLSTCTCNARTDLLQIAECINALPHKDDSFFDPVMATVRVFALAAIKNHGSS